MSRTVATRPASPTGLRHALAVAISGALLLLVVGLFALLVVVPKIAGATPLTVLTSSMEPRLPPGTLIVVAPVDPVDLVIGDVATYQIHSGQPGVITHRIVAVMVNSDGIRSFQFKGDNNTEPDADLILPAQIQGKLWYALPYIGYANNLVSGVNRAWIIPAVAIGLFAYAGYMLVSGLVVATRKRRMRRLPAHRAGGSAWRGEAAREAAQTSPPARHSTGGSGRNTAGLPDYPATRRTILPRV
ncbi:signal peptidase I [Cryobacterium sp. PH29-G1]|uniref:signal peptidase I n=1 Tax=Cryobacterium sp. PH29-G1 TaxID=3046211 RepID=UPI0024B96F81|nr:signal peptidase I [Cryobacterium sp. PH29-G1]MDJ0350925.1 signal peptidase I [Cryobacterium sp. PH29-G1]